MSDENKFYKSAHRVKFIGAKANKQYKLVQLEDIRNSTEEELMGRIVF